MPTPTKGPRLGGGPAHERLILANLATALFEHDQITTTETKAKRMRPLAERLVTFAKRGDLHARRRVMTVIRDKGVVHRLFTEIAPDMAERPGGYTRITKIAPRKGDNAPMAVIELVREPMSAKNATVAEAEAATRRADKEAAARTITAADTTEEANDEPTVTEATEPASGETNQATEPAPAEADAATEPAPAEEPTASEATEAGEPGEPSEATEAAEPSAATETGEPTEPADGGYGPDSAAPLADGSAPEGFTIKGNADSMRYHTTESQWYEQTVAEVWFTTEDAAQAAGFVAPGGAS